MTELTAGLVCLPTVAPPSVAAERRLTVGGVHDYDTR